MIIRKIAAFAVLTAALSVSQAFAAQPERGSAAVHYADLDLSTPAGVRILHRRVAGALEAVCGSYAGTSAVGAQAEAVAITKCRAASRAAVEQRIAKLVPASIEIASAY